MSHRFKNVSLDSLRNFDLHRIDQTLFLKEEARRQYCSFPSSVVEKGMGNAGCKRFHLRDL